MFVLGSQTYCQTSFSVWGNIEVICTDNELSTEICAVLHSVTWTDYNQILYIAVAIGLIVQHIQDLLKPNGNLCVKRLRHNSDSLVSRPH